MSDGSELFEAASRMFIEGFEGGSVEQKRAELRLLFADLAHGVKDEGLSRPLNRAQNALNPERELPLERALKAAAAG